MRRLVQRVLYERWNVGGLEETSSKELDEAYDEGYDEGHRDGHREGYDEGEDDGRASVREEA